MKGKKDLVVYGCVCGLKRARWREKEEIDKEQREKKGKKRQRKCNSENMFDIEVHYNQRDT